MLLNLTKRHLLKTIEFHDYMGIAGDEQVLLTLWLNGKKLDSVLYSRNWFCDWNRKRAQKKLLKKFGLGRWMDAYRRV